MVVCFNSRAREGRDPVPPIGFWDFWVSIHAPARGATPQPMRNEGANHVSIHAPARGATLPRPFPGAGECVSIHAPARGATILAAATSPVTVVSFHAPARGATKSAEDAQAGAGFNSHAPANARRRQVCVQIIKVSIHAPARGAKYHNLLSSSPLKFQFTRPRGARLPTQPACPPNSSFNSRAREGRDLGGG